MSDVVDADAGEVECLAPRGADGGRRVQIAPGGDR